MQAKEGEVTLADGRSLGYMEGGSPEGLPIFYFHGFPGSRKEALLLCGDSSMPDCSAPFSSENSEVPGYAPVWRIFAVDRPGMGISDFQTNRTLRDWPRDVGELADRLGIGRFTIVGVSGGGPYALACAWAMPERVICAGIACGPAQLDEQEMITRIGAANRTAFKLLKHFPGLGKPSYATFAFFLKHWPLMILDSQSHSLPPSDRDVLRNPQVRDALTNSFMDSVRQGSAGGAQELKILCNPWNFNLAEITIPVALWHGELDTIVPVAMGRQIASQFSTCRASFFQEDGHYSLLVNHRDTIMGDLREMTEEGL